VTSRAAGAGGALLFLDAATSGFDPRKDVILEIALMLVSATPELEVLDVAHHLVSQGGLDAFGDVDSGPDVPDFHRKNGLALACFDGGMPLRSIEAQLLAGPWSCAERVVGRGVDFDMKFLRAHMPTFAEQLPQARVLDVNELEYLATRIGRVAPLVRGERTYRAEDDLGEAYEAFRYYTAPSRTLR
jgi:oligoribonuclease (3'-5' exoribonuclease)